MRIFDADSGFSRFMSLLFDIFYVGVLWLVCSLPLITAGASATAAYYAMAKCVRYKTGYIGREFWHSFKANFRQIVPLTVLFWILVAVLSIDLFYIWNDENEFNNTLFLTLLFILFVLTGMTAYLCPILSRFEKKNIQLIKTAIYVFFRYLPITIAIQIVSVIAFVGIFLMPWAVLFIPGLYLFALSYPMEYILRKMMPPVEEDSEEAQMWYYQSTQNKNDSQENKIDKTR